MAQHREEEVDPKVCSVIERAAVSKGLPERVVSSLIQEYADEIRRADASTLDEIAWKIGQQESISKSDLDILLGRLVFESKPGRTDPVVRKSIDDEASPWGENAIRVMEEG